MWTNPPAGVQISMFGGGQHAVWAIRCSNVSVVFHDAVDHFGPAVRAAESSALATERPIWPILLPRGCSFPHFVVESEMRVPSVTIGSSFL